MGAIVFIIYTGQGTDPRLRKQVRPVCHRRILYRQDGRNLHVHCAISGHIYAAVAGMGSLPNGFSKDTTRSATIDSLEPGTNFVVARDTMDSAGVLYEPAPDTQSVEIIGGETWTRFLP